LRIEVSSLPEKDKHELYEEIATSLRSVIWPVIIKHAPKEELHIMAQHPSKLTLQNFSEVIEKIVQDTKALQEIEELMKKIIEKFHDVLTEEGVPQISGKE